MLAGGELCETGAGAGLSASEGRRNGGVESCAAMAGERRGDAGCGAAAGRDLRPEVALQKIGLAGVDGEDVEDLGDEVARVEEAGRGDAQALGPDLGRVDRHGAGGAAADIAPMRHGSGPGGKAALVEDGERDHHVVEMGDAAVMGVVGQEEIAVADGGAVAGDDMGHGLVKRADEGGDARAGGDEPARGIGDAGAAVEHLVDDRAHGRFLEDGEHFVRRRRERAFDDRQGDGVGRHRPVSTTTLPWVARGAAR